MIQSITVGEFSKILETNKNCQLVDVREIPEFESVHIRGSKLFPLSTFEKNINLIERDKPIYISCGVGKRALKAAEYLESLGYKDLYVLEGGIKAWIEANHPVDWG